jgi:hypothetical protein
MKSKLVRADRGEMEFPASDIRFRESGPARAADNADRPMLARFTKAARITPRVDTVLPG